MVLVRKQTLEWRESRWRLHLHRRLQIQCQHVYLFRINIHLRTAFLMSNLSTLFHFLFNGFRPCSNTMASNNAAPFPLIFLPFPQEGISVAHDREEDPILDGSDD